MPDPKPAKNRPIVKVGVVGMIEKIAPARTRMEAIMMPGLLPTKELTLL